MFTHYLFVMFISQRTLKWNNKPFWWLAR